MAQSRLSTLIGSMVGAFVLICCGTDKLTPSAMQQDPQTSGDGLPCEVSSVLVAKCQVCHTTPAVAGAPMPLLTAADFQAPAKSNPSMKVFQLVAQRIHSVDDPMPKPPSKALTDAELASLDAWLNSGAPPSDGSGCGMQNGTAGASATAGTTAAAGMTSNAGGAAGVSASGTNAGGVAGTTNATAGSGDTGQAGMMNAADGGSTETLVYPGAPADCDTAYELRAHGQNGTTDTTKYSVGGGGNHYQCFYFKAPWGTDSVQALNFVPKIDSTATVHHWILYADDDNSQNLQDGSISTGDCSQGNNGNRYFVAGWAPGADPATYPSDVGLQLPKTSNAMLTLEIHYVNNGSTLQDSSGVQMCVTHKFRQNTAAIHWLGVDANKMGTSLINIGAGKSADAVGHCTPNTNQQVHVLSVSPHMHLLGTHQKTVINRKGGGSEMLHDGLFEFTNQIAYPLDPAVVLNPGDSITTTCSYQNTTSSTVKFGEKTQDEMCYNFVLAYPAGALSNGKTGCIPGYPCYPGGHNRCIDEGP